MSVSPPALYWYQLDVGTLAAAYWGQLDTCVRALCTAESVTLPTAPWYSPIAGTLNSAWILQIDTAVRACCTALSVAPPTGSPTNLIAGTLEANYYASLDATVRALCTATETYAAHAVHFAGNTLVQVQSMTAAATISKAVISFWIANTAIKPGNVELDCSPVNIVSSAPQRRMQIGASHQTDTTPLIIGAVIGAGSNYGRRTIANVYPITPWTNIIMSFDWSSALDTGKLTQIYLNGVAATLNAGTGNNVALACPCNGNNLDIGYCSDPDTLADTKSLLDMADVQVWLDLFVDFSVAANVAKIISGGKPVNPTVAATAFGTHSALFSGNASGFSTNQGSVGAAAIVGDPLTNATTSPSD